MPARHVVKSATVGMVVLAMLAVVGSTVGIGLLSGHPWSVASTASGPPPRSVGLSTVHAPTRAYAHTLAGAASLLQELMRAGDNSVPTVSEVRAAAALLVGSKVAGAGTDAGVEAAILPLVTAPPVATESSIAAFAFAGTICFIAGAESLGLACLAAIVGAAVFTLVLFYLGFSDANAQATAAAKNLALQLESDQLFMANEQGTSVANLVNALNGTTTVLGYQAAAAALSQLPNLTFNVPLDLATGGPSGVAGELASEFAASASWLAAYVGKSIADFGRQEGTLNSLPKWCPVFYDGSTLSFPAASATGAVQAADNCGANLPNPLYYASGHIFGGTPPITMGSTASVGLCPVVYIEHGSWVTITDAGAASFVGSFIPVAGDLTWTNLTATSVPDHALINVTWAAASGAYYLCAPTGTVVFYAGDAFPLTTSVVGADPWAPNVYWSPSDNAAALVGNAEGTAGSWTTVVNSNNSACANCFFSQLFDGSSTLYEVNLYGGNTNASANSGSTVPYAGVGGKASPFLNFGNSLSALGKAAGLVGSVYWNFLQTLGYTSESQVPVRCQIPTLGQLLPSSIPVSTLASMNTTSALNLYYTELLALGQTFNATNGLTVANFCGKHLTWNPWNGTSRFGFYGYGWVYITHVGAKSSDGLVNQTYHTPSTWNLSGLIWVFPTLGNYSIPTNTSFQLGQANPAVLMVIPFVKTPTKAGAAPIVNRTGPSWCLTAHASGCNESWADFIETSLVAGNSTKGFGLTGSAFPTFEATGATGTLNVSIFMTACFKPASTYVLADPAYVTTATCQFNTTTLNATGAPCGTAINGCAGTGGGILIVTGSAACGVTLPIYSTLVTAVASFTGTSSLGCLIAEAIAVVLLVVVVVAVLWAVALVVRRDG